MKNEIIIHGIIKQFILPKYKTSGYIIIKYKRNNYHGEILISVVNTQLFNEIFGDSKEGFMIEVEGKMSVTKSFMVLAEKIKIIGENENEYS